jgi:hypothetical protein
MINFSKILQHAKQTKTLAHLHPPTHGYKIKQKIIGIKKITKRKMKREKNLNEKRTID